MTFTFNFNGLNFNNLNFKYIYFNQYIPIDINDPDIGDTKQRKVTKNDERFYNEILQDFARIPNMDEYYKLAEQFIKIN